MATETDNKTNELLAMLLQRMSTQQAQPTAQPVMPAGIMPAGQMQPQAFGVNGYAQQVQPQMPQPTGVSVTLSIPLPDGSTVPVQLHFGPEHALNVQGFVQAILATFGQVVKVYPPRQQWGGGYGQGGYGQGGGYGGNGYGGRRWGRRY